MKKKETLAKIVRIVTVPPVMIIALLIILAKVCPEIYRTPSDLFIMLLLLGIFPALSYPLQPMLPGYKNSGREGQRNLAFLFSVIGYIAALIFTFASYANASLRLISLTYCLSVIILILCNKLFHLRASGHACSQTGPILFLVYFINWKCILPGLLIAALVVWSSLLLKRHSVRDLLSGSLVYITAFCLSLLIMHSLL